MAKDRFERTKIHVNVGTLDRQLQILGFSAAGAREVTQGRIPYQAADRQQLVEQFLRLLSAAHPVPR
ncbi:MAG: hypothetical protein J5I93_04595 [Pirellulaceae bacterium]|nr:hypothetical protein [Pirellulaceae bacterium]